ncbi:MAG TPA: nuclear transport factor 2 family protein [Gammaproteobacteria bacterium]|nr:nuclear transport factor 2 family protein [Gammaproteobacteria bacterium]
MPEITAITKTIEMYFLGTYHGDIKTLQTAFHRDAHITGLFNNNEVDWNLTEFINRVTTQPTAAEKNEPYHKQILSLDYQGNAAMVKAQVEANGILFTDYITLLKINGHWVIRNKSFTTN